MSRVHLGVVPVGHYGGPVIFRWVTACSMVVTDYGDGHPGPSVAVVATEVTCRNCLRTHAWRDSVESERTT